MVEGKYKLAATPQATLRTRRGFVAASRRGQHIVLLRQPADSERTHHAKTAGLSFKEQALMNRIELAAF